MERRGASIDDPIDALILAGRRGGDDPLARAAGVPHRALAEVGGRPMLERVVRCLLDSGRIRSLRVSIDAPELLDRFPGLAGLRDAGRFEVIRSAPSPSQSVLDALDARPEALPLLVTTADHPLLDAAMLAHFLDGAESGGADLAVGLVSRSCIRARFPETRRTYLPFRGEAYSGANLFLFRTGASRRVALFWRRAEHLRKEPWRLVRTFGLGSLLLFALRRLDLEQAFARASRVLEARTVPVALPFPEAAVDVDKPEDLELVRRLVAGGDGP